MGSLETHHVERGLISFKDPNDDRYFVILSQDFPWSPNVLTSQFKLKVFMSSQSSLFFLAQEYYIRFGITISEFPDTGILYSLCESSIGVVDEGKRWSRDDLKVFAHLSRKVPFLRVGSGYNVSARDAQGDQEVWTVKHSDLGGVTDLESIALLWHSPTPGRRTLTSSDNFLKRDLRSVLKSGIDGELSGKPRSLPVTPVSEVVTLRSNVVSSGGIYPLTKGDRLPSVRTLFGTKQWVTRKLAPIELLSLKDIPEPLFLMLKNREDLEVMTRRLFDSCRVPLKSLKFFLSPILQRVTLQPNACCSDLLLPPTVPRSVGPKLFQTSSVALDEEMSPGSAKEMEEEEERCVSPQELIDVLSKRLTHSRSDQRSKKSDYELPSETIWDVRVLPFCSIRAKCGRLLNWRSAFSLLRSVLLKRWKRSILKSIMKYRLSCENHEFSPLDKTAILDCVCRVAAASRWSWDGGSRPFFWNWPAEWQKQSRDGFPMWISDDQVNWTKTQPKPSDKDRLLMTKKLSDVREKGYLKRGDATSLIRFFGVPKGDSDIRMVYDGTKSGLNAALWAPWFPLPTAASHLRLVDCNSWMADNDAGEFFLNWMMDERIQDLCGVDITHFLTEDESRSLRDTGQTRWIEKWTRCAMGLRPSPYVCVKGMTIAKEIILGNRHDPRNVFRWDHVLLNLPGSDGYTSDKPWVSKRRIDGTLAADLICFVDDLRPTAPSEAECWEASQAVSKGMAWLGLQDASRKRNPPSQSPGPWAGVVVTTDNQKVYVSVSQAKWDKAKSRLEELRIACQTGHIKYKKLESITGFLVYVAQAYPSLKPYLSGLYGTLNSWRPDWTPDGWKDVGKNKRQKVFHQPDNRDFEVEETWRLNHLDQDDESATSFNDEIIGAGYPLAPKTVQFLARAKDDICALRELTQALSPPMRIVRGGLSVPMLYGFGDASGAGFGSALQRPNGSLYYQHGLWGEDFSKDNSSNYRELRNLVDFAHRAAADGILTGSQLMLFTDNIVADLAFHKGGSKSRLLHSLIVQLRKLEMTLCAELIIVHVSGLRMIESGIDGISRGEFSAGMMAGQSVHSFIPLHLLPQDRSALLEKWIRSWSGEDTEVLSPNRWPEAHQGGGTYVWFSPPAAGSVVVDYLGDSLLKRSNSVHIIVIPRVMTSIWRKNLGKTSDVEFEIPIDVPVWPAGMFEPLLVFISLPLSRDRNEKGSWRFKGSQRIVDVGIALHRMWPSDLGGIGDTLRKLLCQSREVRAL